MAGPVPVVLWALALGCWLYLFAGARGRARLLRALAHKRSGSVKRRFSFVTMTPEVAECLCPGRAGGADCRFRVRYELSALGGRSGTIFQVEGAFEIPEGEYLPADFLAGRGLTLGGTDFTEGYSALARALPAHAPPSFAWGIQGIRCRVPALLGIEHELAAERCLLFMCELAAASEASKRPAKI